MNNLINSEVVILRSEICKDNILIDLEKSIINCYENKNITINEIKQIENFYNAIKDSINNRFNKLIEDYKGE